MSRIECYSHIVWSTMKRNPLIIPEVEAWLYPFVMTLARQQGHEVLAVNGMPDHVHVILQLAPKVDYPDLMKRIKGASATYINKQMGLDIYFRWNEGYFIRSITPAHLDMFIGYVHKQKQHHAEGTLRARWEIPSDAGNEDPDETPSERTQ